MAAVGTRTLTVSIDSTDYTAAVSTCEVTSAETDSDFTSFTDAAAGGKRDYKLHIVAVQDHESASFWDKIWSTTGSTVDYLIKPYGNAAASATQPHYTGEAIVSEPDGVLLGGEADASASARFTIEVEWACLDKPTKVVT